MLKDPTMRVSGKPEKPRHCPQQEAGGLIFQPAHRTRSPDVVRNQAPISTSQVAATVAKSMQAVAQTAEEVAGNPPRGTGEKAVMLVHYQDTARRDKKRTQFQEPPSRSPSPAGHTQRNPAAPQLALGRK